MPTLRLVPLAALLACAPESDLIRDTDVEDTAEPVDTDAVDTAVEEPEAPRFYLIDVPHSPAVSDLGHVLLFDPWTGGDVYVWTEEQGLEWVANTGAYFNTVDDISADGTTIIGSYGNYMIEEDTQAAIWTAAAGWTKLGALPGALDCPMQSAGWSLTGDGAVAAGLAFRDGCDAVGFRWDAVNGMTAYEQVGTGGNRVSRISENGALAVGFAQGNSARTPAVWFADGSGEVLNPNWDGEFYGVNPSGTRAVGQLGTKGFVWTPADGHTFLGTLGGPGETRSRAVDLCGPDDELIIGTDTLAGGTATAWTAETELISMEDWLVGLGVVLPPNTHLTDAVDCSPDKRFIVGHGAVDEKTGVWVAVLPAHLFETN